MTLLRHSELKLQFENNWIDIEPILSRSGHKQINIEPI